MTYEQYRMLFYIFLALSLLSLLVAVILFFKFRIVSVVGDLSGSKARKEIENIRQQNASGGNKAFNSSVTNVNRGKITDRISLSGKVQSKSSKLGGMAMGTSKIQQPLNSPAQTVLDRNQLSEETTVLTGQTDSNETTVLAGQVNNETTVLTEQTNNNETTVLGSASHTGQLPVGSAETTVLGYEANNNKKAKIVIEEDITFVHSNEHIN